jgi:hypothetical protein
MSLSSLSNRERWLFALFALLLLAAVAGPAVSDPGFGGAPFADAHAWGVLPNAMDVLSNLPFIVIGVWGLYRLRGLDRAHEHAMDAAPFSFDGKGRGASRWPVNALDCAWIFFAGLILTGLGSAFYHLQPDGMRLAADRAGMAAAFAGLIGMAVCERVSARAGWPAAWFALAGGLWAAAVGHCTGNVLPWALVQFGGMALVVLLAFTKPVEGAIGLRLGWVIVCYALAKGFELSDAAVFDAARQMISGHSLKHLSAALAAVPVLHALQAIGRRPPRRHNPRAITLMA